MAQYELNLIDYWLIVKKRKYAIGVTAVLVLSFTVLLTELFKPTPVYEASARVKYDRTNTLASLLLESIATMGGSDLGTQSEVVRSFPVLEQAAKEMHLVPADTPDDGRRSAEYINAVYRLQQRTRALQEPNTNVIKITVAGETSEMAEQGANAVANAYRNQNIQERNRLVTLSRQYVEAQLVSLEQGLREAEDRLREFKEREGQVFLTEEAKAALDAFTKLEADYDKVLRLKNESQRQMEILAKHQTTAETAQERIFTEEPSAQLTVLNNRWLDLQQERANALIHYTPEHPLVKELDRKIDVVKRELARELESKLKSLTNREAALKEQIDLYRDRYFSFPRAAIDLSRLEREVKVNADLYAQLKSKHQELMIKSAEQISEVTILEPAVAPHVAINAPNTLVNVVVGSLMGIFLGFVVAFMRESFDTSIATIEGVEEFLKVPVLGVIPRFDEKEQLVIAAKELPPDISKETLNVFAKLITLYDPKSVLSEGFRSLRTNIQFASTDRNIKSMLFTSAGLGEGKTTTVVNLAITLAQDGKHVLLIDGDLRRPIIHHRFGLQRDPGLSEVLVGMPWRDAVRSVTDLILGTLGVDRVLQTPGLDNLSVLTSGAIPPNPSEFLSSPRLKEILAEMHEEFDIILLDTPPILPIGDAIQLANLMDAAVLVYQVGRISRNALKRAKFLLDHAQAKVLGLVLTDVRPEFTPEYTYYRYDYK